MTSRIFSINLDDVTFAKLGELQKKYPDKSRNAMIRHIINVVHSLEEEDVLRMEARNLKMANQHDFIMSSDKIYDDYNRWLQNE